MAEPEWKIVLIDDEPDIREVMTLTLEDAGYRVYPAPNGEEGIATVKAVCPQMVITDIRMPVMDGIAVLEAVKKNSPEIEVIVCTAFGEMDMAIRALRLDASDFITKPINNEALHLALDRAKNRYVDRKQIRDYTAILEVEKAQTAEELKKIIEFQKNLLESSMDGILGLDEKERVVVFNRGMEQLLGYDRSKALHRMGFDQFFRPEGAARFKAALAGEKHGGTGRLFLFETALTTAAGSDVPVQVSASALSIREERAGLVCFFRDLREIRRLEREVEDQARILHQDKMISLGKLAASVVHEINNPLSGILNYLRLMLRMLSRGPVDGGAQAKFQRYLTLVEEETSRCATIVSSLLAFSRKSPPSFETISVETLLSKCAVLSGHKLALNHIQFKSDAAPDLPPIRGDANQLQQCLINLIFNAIDAMPDGGELIINARADAQNRQIVILVSDTGVGIPEADIPHLFEPFFTTKQQGYGVGLGLSTAYGILERHQGTIEVESRPGKGSTFTIRLPAQG
jgi:two-component system, NtrC family, sensor kinase